MSLVSNFIGGISGLNGITNGQNVTSVGLDINDTTFAELLKKQLSAAEETQPSSGLAGTFGIPAGMQIDGMDGTEFSEKAFDQAEALDAKSDNDENNQNNIMDLNNDGDVTSSEMLTFFSSLLDNNTAGQEARSELFDFARKQAANFYNKYSKDVVSNLEDLVSDIKEKIS